MHSYKKWLLASIATSMLLSAVSTYAAITGAISGTVSDTTGAVIPGVTVAVLNQGTGIKQTVVTDSKGFFSFPALDVGTYTVSVSQAGFASYQESGVKIDANSAVTADIHLKVGSVTQITEVTANPVQIETQSSQLGEVIESQKITAVPLNGRSFTDLLALQPGVSPYYATSETSYGAGNSVSGSLQAGNMSVNGGREASNGFMVNGGDVNDDVENGTAIIPNLDSISEFRIITDNFSAEYGNFSGGQVNVVTKSGTSAFHGSGFEFLRNTDFNAANYFSRARPAYDQNIYGGTLGGPIRKNKMFFFGDFQGTNSKQATVENVETASTADLTGDVSDGAYLMTKKVNGTGWAGVLTNRLGYAVTAGEPYYTSTCAGTGECVFPGATIPAAAWDPVAANLFKYFPAPNSTISASSPTGTVPAYLNSSLAETLHDYKESGRVDVNTRFGTLFAYYFLDNDAFVNPYGGGTDGKFPLETNGRAMLSNLGLTTTFSNNAVNSFRFSYMRSIWHNNFPTYPEPGPSFASLGFITPWGPAGGIDGLEPGYEGVPHLRVDGMTFGQGGTGDGHFDNTFQWLDNYMKIVGTHTLQAGVNFHYDEVDERNFGSVNGSMSFSNGRETGFGIADFLLGAIASNFTQSSPQYLDSRGYYFGGYMEDSWRARPALTLNYGVRYEITTPWWDEYNRMEGIVPGLQSKVFPNSPMGWVFPGDTGVPRTFASIKHNKFAPRFGFAYAPGASSGFFSKLFGGPNKTSIRGGFGIFFTNFQQESGYEEAGDAPYGDFYQASVPSMMYAPYIDRATQHVEAPKFPFNWPPKNVSVSNPFSDYDFVDAEPIAGSFAVNVNNTVPYLEEYTLSIQRQLGSATVFTVNYVGSEGRHLANTEESNPASAALCGTLSGSALAAGQTDCGPNLETQTYTLADGTTQYGTEILNIQDSCICFGSNPLQDTLGTSNYNSLQMNIKHTSQMWDILLGYTYSKSMDNSSGMEDETYVLDPQISYGLSEFNVPQYFVASYNIHLPFDHWVGNDWGKRFVGGWSVTGVTKLAKGTPVTLSEDDDNSETATGDDVPNYTGGNLFAGGAHGDKNPRHGNPWFDTSLFSPETVGVFGDTHRRFFAGPGLNATDLALLREFHIREANVIQFRAEAFNVFNHTEFSAPDGDINDDTFGTISSAKNPRVLQLAVKYRF